MPGPRSQLLVNQLVTGVEPGVIVVRFGGMNDQRVENSGRAPGERERPPGFTGIIGAQEQRIACTDQNYAPIMGINRKRPCASTIGTRQLPSANKR